MELWDTAFLAYSENLADVVSPLLRYAFRPISWQLLSLHLDFTFILLPFCLAASNMCPAFSWRAPHLSNLVTTFKKLGFFWTFLNQRFSKPPERRSKGKLDSHFRKHTERTIHQGLPRQKQASKTCNVCRDLLRRKLAYPIPLRLSSPQGYVVLTPTMVVFPANPWSRLFAWTIVFCPLTIWFKPSGKLL